MTSIEEQRMDVVQEGARPMNLTEYIDFTGVPVDMDYMKKKGITREVVKNLLKVDNDKYTDQLFLIHANYNRKDRSQRIKRNIILRILKEFKLYRLASDKGPENRWTNSRGSHLCYITGNRELQKEKVRELCKQIKQQLLQSDANLSMAHVVASLVIYYGENEEQEHAAAADDEEEEYEDSEEEDNEDLIPEPPPSVTQAPVSPMQ